MFAATVFDPGHGAFVIHIAALSVDPDDEVHPSKRAQIAYLKADKAPTKIPSKYSDFADVFFLKLAVKLPKHTRINEYTIKLVDDWQSLYGPIYSLGLVELEILKAYIENNMANGFIMPSKSPVKALIFFDKKPDGSLRLYMDYQGLNNLTIKNRYLLSLIGELLDWLSQVWQFN